MEVYYSSIKHHKLKMRVELKERKIGDFSRTTLGNSMNGVMIIVNFILLAIVFQLMYNFIFCYHVHDYYIHVLQNMLF